MGLVLLIPSLEGWTSSEDAFWIFKVTSAYDFARANFSQKQNRNGKTLTKILVAIVTICMSIIAGLSLIVLLVDVSGTPL